jgi:hypothetical protein
MGCSNAYDGVAVVGGLAIPEQPNRSGDVHLDRLQRCGQLQNFTNGGKLLLVRDWDQFLANEAVRR